VAPANAQWPAGEVLVILKEAILLRKLPESLPA
jgi:hypothetical protein